MWDLVFESADGERVAVPILPDAARSMSEEELRRIIRDAGFVPKQRDTLYRTYFLN